MGAHPQTINGTPRVELPPRRSQRNHGVRDPQELATAATSVTSHQRESPNKQLFPRIAPPKYRVEKPEPPSSSKAFRNKLESTPSSTLSEGQRLVWNPKYHSIDESRVNEGFYGVKNALGPGGRTLFISCLEAEVQCITFGAFWTMNPSSYGSIAMALVTGQLQLEYTIETFHYCIPKEKNTLVGSLLGIDSSIYPSPEAKVAFTYLRSKRRECLRHKQAMWTALQEMSNIARGILVLDNVSKAAVYASRKKYWSSLLPADFAWFWNPDLGDYRKMLYMMCNAGSDYAVPLISLSERINELAPGMPFLGSQERSAMDSNRSLLAHKIEATRLLSSQTATALWNFRDTWKAHQKLYMSAWYEKASRTEASASKSAKLLSKMPPELREPPKPWLIGGTPYPEYARSQRDAVAAHTAA